MVLKPVKLILVVLGVVLVVLELVLMQVLKVLQPHGVLPQRVLTPMKTYIPHLLCHESYHLGSHFGTIWGWMGWVLGGFKTAFLWFLGLLKFVKKSPIKPLGAMYCCPTPVCEALCYARVWLQPSPVKTDRL